MAVVIWCYCFREKFILLLVSLTILSDQIEYKSMAEWSCLCVSVFVCVPPKKWLDHFESGEITEETHR